MKIYIHSGYTIPDSSTWRDMVDLLRYLGKDINGPKYVCPQNLKAEHDKLVWKGGRQGERKKMEKKRQETLENERGYLRAKGVFFRLTPIDNLILVRMIESVAEILAEGRAIYHRTGQYHKREDSLILSATIDGERIETIEVDLRALKVVQSRGVCNSNTGYHDRIIKLVEDNTEQIRQRINAA